jgi:hypothetical protein
LSPLHFGLAHPHLKHSEGAPGTPRVTHRTSKRLPRSVRGCSPAQSLRSGVAASRVARPREFCELCEVPCGPHQLVQKCPLCGGPRWQGRNRAMPRRWVLSTCQDGPALLNESKTSSATAPIPPITPLHSIHSPSFEPPAPRPPVFGTSFVDHELLKGGGLHSTPGSCQSAIKQASTIFHFRRQHLWTPILHFGHRAPLC